MFSRTILEIPVVYKLIKRIKVYRLIFLNMHSLIHKPFSNFHTSPLGPLPYEGGSIIMASYL